MVNYAAPYRFVPTSLGNECANPLFAAGRKFMDFDQAIAVGLKMKVSIGLSLFSINLITVPLFELKYQCLVGASSIPPQTQLFREVSRLNVGFKYILFGLIEIKDKGSYFKGASAPNTYLPIDGVPGSINTFLEFKELRNYASGVGNWYYSPEDFLLFTISIKEVVKLKFYSFIKAYQYNSGIFTTQYTALPVGSALDVDPFNGSTFTQKYVNGFNQNFPSKGNTFIAQESVSSQSLFNNRSMRFTARNARFMFKEMEQQPNSEVCSGECANPYFIAGADPVCTTGTFTVPGLQRGVGISWTVTSPNLATPPPSPITGNSVTLTRNGTANGVLTLTANLGAGCSAPATISRQVIIGIGVNNITFSRCIINCDAGPYLYADIVPVPGATNCKWYYKDMSNASNPFIFLEDAMFGTDWPLRRSNRNYTIRAEVITPCGSLIGEQVVFAPSCTGLRVVASPNPTTGSINLTFSEQDDSTSTSRTAAQDLAPVRSVKSTGKTIVSLFEFNTSFLVRQWIQNEATSKMLNYNIYGLRKGLYVLQVDRDNKTATTKIIVE